MLQAYFVSDIHITSPDSDRARLFSGFLRGLSGKRNASHLFLLGDIFDLWVAGHQYFVDRYREIVDQVGRLKDEGVEVHYFEGNHDLHLQYFWAERLGLEVHPGPIYLELGGRTVRLEHGDQMDPEDRGYLFLRWLLRTPPVRLSLRHLPGGFVKRLGEHASATSRAYTSETKTISSEDAIRKVRAHAALAFEERPFDLIISGHVHVRDDHATGRYRCVNLGSWFDAPCYFRIDESTAKFHELVAGTAPVQSAAHASEATIT